MQNTSPDYPFKRWHQQAAKNPGFIGYGLALLRERTSILEEQQRAAIGIPLEATYDPVWLHLQAIKFPRSEAFEEDTRRTAEYIIQKAQDQHRLEISLNLQELLSLLIEARREMAVKVTSRQPFAIEIPGVGGAYVAEARHSEYVLYLPEGMDQLQVELQVTPSGGGDFITEWAHRIRACTDDKQAVKLLTSFALTLSEAMTNRMLDSMSDLLGAPRITSE